MIVFPMHEVKRLDYNTPSVLYGIYCPHTEDLVYIGRTINFKARVAAHLSTKEKNKKSKWIMELRALGMMPLFEILEQCDSVDDAIILEAELIKEYKPIYNTK